MLCKESTMLCKESSCKDSLCKLVVVEYKVSMHCKACERTVAKVISKFKGVETFSTDMVKHCVIVKGRIQPDKILKKLKRKTGKKVEIVAPPCEPTPEAGECCDKKPPVPVVCDDWGESCVFTLFSDENPNACSIM